jgi:hypothetical protein
MPDTSQTVGAPGHTANKHDHLLNSHTHGNAAECSALNATVGNLTTVGTTKLLLNKTKHESYLNQKVNLIVRERTLSLPRNR